jgi:hypothetical protein
MRFCRSCGFDFDSQPSRQPPDGRSDPDWYAGAAHAPLPAALSSDKPDDNQSARLGGIAWIICAALTGYLALLQYGAVGTLNSFGLNSGDLQTYAAWNGIAAALTVYFGVRLLQRPNRGFLGTSTAWGAISVLGGVYQVSTGATNEIFLGSIVAAGVAGVLSFAARSVTPEEKLPPEPPHLNRFERLPAPMRLFWVVIGFMVVIGVILVIQALASHPG